MRGRRCCGTTPGRGASIASARKVHDVDKLCCCCCRWTRTLMRRQHQVTQPVLAAGQHCHVDTLSRACKYTGASRGTRGAVLGDAKPLPGLCCVLRASTCALSTCMAVLGGGRRWQVVAHSTAPSVEEQGVWPEAARATGTCGLAEHMPTQREEPEREQRTKDGAEEEGGGGGGSGGGVPRVAACGSSPAARGPPAGGAAAARSAASRPGACRFVAA